MIFFSIPSSLGLLHYLVYTFTVTFEDPTANGLQFRGFFIQSRLIDMTTLVGEFTVTDRNNSKLRPCGNDDPVSDIIYYKNYEPIASPSNYIALHL